MKKFFTLALLFLAFTAAPAQAAVRENLKIGMLQYPSTLHPFFDEMVAKSLVLGATIRPITAYDDAWKPVCILCETLPSFENGGAQKTEKDGKTGITATYTLKKDLFWGDGTPVTAKDVIFAWEVGKHPLSGVGNGEFFAKDIAKITAQDDRIFTIHFTKEKCDFAPIGDFFALPAHLEEKIFKEDPKNYKNRTLYNTAPQTAGLYNGPYVISGTESGAEIMLVKNLHWKGSPPAFETVSFRAIENSGALTANLLSGNIDYIAGELGLSLDQALSFEKRIMAQHPGKFSAVYKPSLTYEHIDLPLQRPPFNDIRIRRALMHAMDRDTINVTIFSGKQPVALSGVNPLDTVFTRDVMLYPHDLAQAETLLEEAGWKKREDGWRYNDKNEKLTITLATTAGNKTREVIQQALQADWERAGIDTVIKNEPARVLFGDTMRKRQFEGGVMYAWMSAPRSIPKTTLHSAMIPAAGNNYAGQNYPGYANPVMDKIIDDLDTVCAEDKNLNLWKDLQKLYADELPALPLYYRADSFFIPSWLSGLKPTGHLHPTTLWIEDWSAAP